VIGLLVIILHLAVMLLVSAYKSSTAYATAPLQVSSFCGVVVLQACASCFS